MAPPSPGDAAPSSAAAALQHQGPYPPLAPSGASAASVDVSRFPELAAALESLKWRAIPRPGGAQMKVRVDWMRIMGACKTKMPRR